MSDPNIVYTVSADANNGNPNGSLITGCKIDITRKGNIYMYLSSQHFNGGAFYLSKSIVDNIPIPPSYFEIIKITVKSFGGFHREFTANGVTGNSAGKIITFLENIKNIIREQNKVIVILDKQILDKNNELVEKNKLEKEQGDKILMLEHENKILKSKQENKILRLEKEIESNEKIKNYIITNYPNLAKYYNSNFDKEIESDEIITQQNEQIFRNKLNIFKEKYGLNKNNELD